MKNDPNTTTLEQTHTNAWQRVIAIHPANLHALHAAILAERAAYEAMIIAENTPKRYETK